MPRKKKTSPAEQNEPTALSEPLSKIAEKHNLVPAADVLQPLSPPEIELEPLKREVVEAPVSPPAERPRPEDDTQIASEPETNGKLHHEPELERLLRGSWTDRAKTVFSGVEAGFKLKQGHANNREYRVFQFEDERPPAADEKAMLRDAGFAYSPNEKSWVARATPDVRDASDKLALTLSGKAETIRGGR